MQLLAVIELFPTRTLGAFCVAFGVACVAVAVGCILSEQLQRWASGLMAGTAITSDAAVGDLVVNGERPKIFLNGHTLKVRKVASKAEQERIRARVQDADMGGGILWSQGLLRRGMWYNS